MAFYNIGEIGATMVLRDEGFLSGISNAARQTERLDAMLLGMAGAAAVALTGVFNLTQQTADYADASIKMSRRVGMQVENLTALHHAANLSGVSQRNLEIGMQRFTRRAAEAADGTGVAKKALAEMNIQLRDNQGNLKSTDNLLLEVADSLQKLPPGADRTRLAFKLFDSEGVGLINMLKDGSEGIRQMTNEAIALGLVIDTQSAEASERWNDSITKLNASFTGLGRQIGVTVIKMMDKVGAVELLTKAVSSLTNWWMDLDEETREWIVTLGGVVAGMALIGGGFVALKLALPPLVAAWNVAMGSVTASTALATGGITLLLGALALITTWGIRNRSRLGNIFSPIKNAIEPVIKSISDIKKSLSEMIGAIPGIDSFKNFIKGLLDSTGKAKALEIIFKGIAIYLRIGAGIFQIWLSAIKIVFKALTQVKKLLAAIWESIKRGSTDPIRDMWKISLDKMKIDLGVFKKDVKGIGKDIVKIWNAEMRAATGPAEEARKTTTGKITTKVGGDLKPPEFDWKGEVSKYAALHQAILGDALTVYTAITDAAIDAQRRAMEKMAYQIDIFNEWQDRVKEAELEKLREFEDQRLAIIEKGIADRRAALDREWAATKARLEREYGLILEQDMRRLELKLGIIQRDSVIQEQADTATEITREDARRIAELRQKEHEERLREALKEHNDRIRGIEKTNGDLLANERDASNKKIEAAEKAADREMIERKRLLSMLLYAQSVAAFNQAKQQRIAQSYIESAAGQIAAFVSGVSSGIPYPYNLIAGGAAATAVLAASATRIQMIEAQQAPPPPPDLFFEQGGLTPGTGAIPIMAHEKEYIMNRRTTEKVDRAASNRIQRELDSAFPEKQSATGNEKILVVFEEGAIVIQHNGDIDSETARELARQLAPAMSKELGEIVHQRGY